MALAGSRGKGNGVAFWKKFTTVVNMDNVISVTSTEANRSFARLMRKVKEGVSIDVTSHGEAFAEIRPKKIAKDDEHMRRLTALAELEAHWATLTPVTVGPWTRDELYAKD